VGQTFLSVHAAGARNDPERRSFPLIIFQLPFFIEDEAGRSETQNHARIPVRSLNEK